MWFEFDLFGVGSRLTCEQFLAIQKWGSHLEARINVCVEGGNSTQDECKENFYKYSYNTLLNK